MDGEIEHPVSTSRDTPSHRDTIFALATARGRAALAVLRVSGPGAGTALKELAGRLPLPRRATRVRLRNHAKEAIDDALVLWMPGPGSSTGEDVAEFHLHGGPAVLSGAVAALARLSGFRPAGPGEFTRRAFENGLVDLTAAEGLADLVAAETAVQARQALAQAGGQLGKLYDEWRATLISLMAQAEAEIDFPDEDVPEGVFGRVRGRLVDLRSAIAAHLDDGGRGERLRQGFRVALVGPPNVGKSSLINALAKRDVAIVTDEPGTTRDLLECHLDLGGYPVTIVDMAGLRESAAKVEAIGIEKARHSASTADLRLFLVEASRPTLDPLVAKLRQPQDLVVLTKSDLGIHSALPVPAAIAVSAVTGAGLPALLSLIEQHAAAALAPSEAPVLTRARHRQALQRAVECLDRALAQADDQLELLAEELRLAARALGEITGRVDVEDILDVVFAEFCIGK